MQIPSLIRYSWRGWKEIFKNCVSRDCWRERNRAESDTIVSCLRVHRSMLDKVETITLMVREENWRTEKCRKQLESGVFLFFLNCVRDRKLHECLFLFSFVHPLLYDLAFKECKPFFLVALYLYLFAQFRCFFAVLAFANTRFLLPRFLKLSLLMPLTAVKIRLCLPQGRRFFKLFQSIELIKAVIRASNFNCIISMWQVKKKRV